MTFCVRLHADTLTYTQNDKQTDLIALLSSWRTQKLYMIRFLGYTQRTYTHSMTTARTTDTLGTDYDRVYERYALAERDDV